MRMRRDERRPASPDRQGIDQRRGIVRRMVNDHDDALVQESDRMRDGTPADRV
jgi:hypothetical protein